MQAGDIMTRQVITIDPDSSIADAAKLMLEHRISGMPVVDAESRLVGIISEGDLLRRAEMETDRQPRSWWLSLIAGPFSQADEQIGGYVKEHGRTVRDVMSRVVQTVDETTPLDQVVHLMEKNRIKRVPVVHDNKLVGIISRANIMRTLVSVGSNLPKATADDQEIRKNVLAALEGQPWAPRSGENVVVRDGVVHLWGAVSSETQRDALVVAAQNVPGVKRVEDHIDVSNPLAHGVLDI